MLGNAPKRDGPPPSDEPVAASKGFECVLGKFSLSAAVFGMVPWKEMADQLPDRFLVDHLCEEDFRAVMEPACNFTLIRQYADHEFSDPAEVLLLEKLHGLLKRLGGMDGKRMFEGLCIGPSGATDV